MQWEAVSTGDGLLIVVDPNVSTAKIVRAVIWQLQAALVNYNRLAMEVARMRVRCVVHAAYVLRDEQGVVGDQVNKAFRLLDSGPLRRRLKREPGPLVVGVS